MFLYESTLYKVEDWRDIHFYCFNYKTEHVTEVYYHYCRPA